MKSALALLCCYLIGSLSGAYLIGKIFLHDDIRTKGSGNAGTTNAIRVMGKKLGYLTFLIDVLKGIIAMVAVAPMVDESFRFFAGVFVVLGHNYPFYLGFRGGKGIATTFGAWGALEPLFVAFSAICGYLVGKKTQYVSVGSLTFLSVLSVLMLKYHSASASAYNQIAIVIVWVLGFIRHRSNLKRIREGTENRVGGH